MKRLGSALMIVGAFVGVAAAVWITVGLDLAGLPWLVAVGLVKLAIVASLGIMGAGAILTRAAKRAERATERKQIASEMLSESLESHRREAQAERRRES